MEGVEIIELPKILDPRGNLTFIEMNIHVPFDIKRTFWTYDVPGGQIRGGHAYKEAKEFIVALSGSFDVVLNDGKEERTFSLNRSYYGLYVPAMIWKHLENFSTNSLCLTLSSDVYNKEDYLRDIDQYKSLKL